MDRRIRLAISMAHKSRSRFRLGAVVVKRRQIVSTGYNQMRKTHPKQQQFCSEEHTIGLHAEVHACLGVDLADLDGAEIFVARVLKSGQTALARPCGVCRQFLASVGVRLVTYTTCDGVDRLEL